MVADTYELFLARWDKLIGAENHFATAVVPETKHTGRYVHLTKFREETHRRLVWEMGESDRAELAGIMLLLNNDATYE